MLCLYFAPREKGKESPNQNVCIFAVYTLIQYITQYLGAFLFGVYVQQFVVKMEIKMFVLALNTEIIKRAKNSLCRRRTDKM